MLRYPRGWQLSMLRLNNVCTYESALSCKLSVCITKVICIHKLDELGLLLKKLCSNKSSSQRITAVNLVHKSVSNTVVLNPFKRRQQVFNQANSAPSKCQARMSSFVWEMSPVRGLS